MMRKLAVVLAAVVAGLPAPAPAQAAARVPAPAEAQDRVRQRFAALLRERVGLSDDQLQRLAPVSRAFETRRQTLFREERAARQALRRELSADVTDQARVAGYIDQLLALQRRRLDLLAEEQRELATFMTPAQRARYLALQEHVRRRAEEMRRRRGNGPFRGSGRRGGVGPGQQF